MITTDLKIAIRNLFRNKVHSLISILGLGIGLGSIILLMALILHENSFDRFIPGYRNVNRITFGKSFSTPFPLAAELKKDFPEVKDFFRFCMSGGVGIGTPKTKMTSGSYFGFADTSIFKILGIKLIAGTAAKTVNEVTLSETTASRYFGNTSPLGAVLLVGLNPFETLTLSVTGIYKDFPNNSTLFPNFIADIRLSEKLFRNYQTQMGQYGDANKSYLNWDNSIVSSFVVIDKNADKKSLAIKMQKYKELLSDQSLKDQKFSFQPVSQIYLGSDGMNGYRYARMGNANSLKYYWSISFLILLISVTNYIFLTRAATSNRLRELGTRKILGASRNMLRRQILTESVFITILSLIPATFVIDSGMTFINRVLNITPLSNEVFSNPVMWLLLAGVVIFTGTISGLLIGNNISRTPSLLLLNGKNSERSKSKRWDNSFLMFHFSIYTILVAGVLIVSKQIKYSETSLQGINPKNIFFTYLNGDKLQSGFKTICNEMEKVPGVIKIAGSSFIPPINYNVPLSLTSNAGEKITFDGLIMGEGMTELLGIDIIEGSSFGQYQGSAVEALFNESSAKKYNLKVGDIYMGAHVRGIVRDFRAHTLHELIQPMMILQQNPDKMGLVAIKTDGKNDKAVISRFNEILTQIDPEFIFGTNYLTDRISSYYNDEKNQASLGGAFSLLSTVLAIMGLFGIALISIARKTKEIGLRKVNGASIPEVMYLLNKEFIIWVMFSLVISLPASFYLMSGWLKRFAYKTELNWWIFAIAAVSAILIALITVSWQSWRAATRNPVEALRHE